MTLGIDVFGLSDIGHGRDLNEDNFLCFQLSKEASSPRTFSCLLAVADGIGGHAGGVVASSLAVLTLKEEVAAAFHGGTFRDGQEILEEAFQRANRQIFEKASHEEELIGMGTTLVAALADADQAVVSNVGDSRAYLIRDGVLHQITQDHSWAAEQRRMNILSKREIEHSPYKSMLTRSLGFEPDVVVDSFIVELKEGDFLLFCTDGLYGPVAEKKIVKIFKKLKTPKDICPELIDLAIRSGTQDNITAVVARLQKLEKGQEVSLTDTVWLESYASNEDGGKSIERDDKKR